MILTVRPMKYKKNVFKQNFQNSLSKVLRMMLLSVHKLKLDKVVCWFYMEFRSEIFKTTAWILAALEVSNPSFSDLNSGRKSRRLQIFMHVHQYSWQYRLWSFQGRNTRLKKVIILENKVIWKLMLTNNLLLNWYSSIKQMRKILMNFDTSPLHQFAKSSTLLWVCWFLAKKPF